MVVVVVVVVKNRHANTNTDDKQCTGNNSSSTEITVTGCLELVFCCDMCAAKLSEVMKEVQHPNLPRLIDVRGQKVRSMPGEPTSDGQLAS